MLKMLKGLVISTKKDNKVEEYVQATDEKELSFRPEKGSLTRYWMMKQKNNLETI